MDVRKYIELIRLAENMKNNTRHSWTSKGRHESVAEHSFRLCFMAYFVKDEFPEADVDKLLKMCLFHDIGEAFTGDIPAFDKTKADEQREDDTVSSFIESLPDAYRMELRSLFDEMNAMESLEAKIYKALDKLEALIQHNEADISTWLPLEYELQMTYGAANMEFSEYMKLLRAEVNRDSEEKIQDAGKKE